jgi:hypothetical protein
MRKGVPALGLCVGFLVEVVIPVEFIAPGRTPGNAAMIGIDNNRPALKL